MKLELRGITKVFGSLVANDHIDLVIEPGEIHALLGENGAGKSTLMNVLYGLYDPDDGQILVDDVPVQFAGPGDAMAAGIGMVHQHFMLVPVFTVAENVALGHEPVKGAGLIDARRARRLVQEISDRFGFEVNPDAMVEDIPVGVQQRVEIIKALSRDARVLILDEPTAVLTPQETDELIAIMRELKAAGTSIVFITHKLREVRAVADRITVIRRGKVVGTADPSASETELASLMVGRSVSLGVDKAPAESGDTTFHVDELTVMDDAGTAVVDRVSLEVARGEILVVAGVQGNGQTELTETIVGLRKPVAGSILLDGKELVGRSVSQVLEAGVGYVPEDRSTDGIIGTFSVEENLVLDLVTSAPYSRGGALARGTIRANAEQRIGEFDVRTQSVETPAGTLSGGNQQKVVLAREMSRPLRLFIASQPTRGLDVGSIEFVHRRIVQERDNGTPVIIVSTELDEVLALADRIAVMYRGRVVGVVPGDTDRDVLGLMMAGVPLEEAVVQAAEHHTTLGEADAVAEDAPSDAAQDAAAAREEEIQ
ncbi:ABC transporter ATP-binding protein [Cellulosimicrobium cellulans]|uniref:ABC transporter ATP-binding protein n=1 Tax=Cellulosimicrobium TaxID=157920 RepID=UPI000884996E|nr:ABC transporter ATP-binding protein [Sphaerisporangium cinnabarinum]MCR1984154.1 ABC transporter ATP-binding protein [Cellulosimicrobium cellulans]PTU57145.1 ABC transporter ATP-binding protein [Sphaerisporangium cinnabarinum]SDF90315.1 nucleoside ABC transporter ATP-binding protein [Cellulosimicrobium cellulans]